MYLNYSFNKIFRQIVQSLQNTLNGGFCGDMQLNYMASHIQRTIGQYGASFRLQNNQIIIELRKPVENFILRAAINDQSLPPSFVNIFDCTKQLFEYFQNDYNGGALVQGNILKIMVKTIRLREVKIDLDRVPLSKVDILEQRIQKIESKSEKFDYIIENALTNIKQALKQKLVEEFNKKTLGFMNEVKRLEHKQILLQQKIRSIQLNNNHNNQLIKAAPYPNIPRMSAPVTIGIKQKTNASTKQSQNIFKIAQTKQAIKPQQLQQMQFQKASFQTPLQRLGSVQKEKKIYDFHFDIDESNQYIEYFKIDRNTVTRKKDDQQIYMISSSNHIPFSDEHSIKMKINQINEGLIWVGLITEEKKSEKYIGEEAGIIQFSLEGNMALIDGKKSILNLEEYKKGDILQMRVKISKKKVRFYKNGRPQPQYQIEIPSTIWGKKLYPYIQMINEGDSVTFL